MAFRAGRMPQPSRRRQDIPYLRARVEHLRHVSDVFMRKAMNVGSEDRGRWEEEANLCARWAGDIEEELKR